MIKTQGFFNETLSRVQKLVYDDVNGKVAKEVDSKYYDTPVDDYFHYCLRIGKHFGTSPRDIYENWSLPMVIVSFVCIHNESVTEFGYQQDSMKDNKPKIIHYENNYIYNITADMVAEMVTEEKESKFAPEQEALLAMYERN